MLLNFLWENNKKLQQGEIPIVGVAKQHTYSYACTHIHTHTHTHTHTKRERETERVTDIQTKVHKIN